MLPCAFEAEKMVLRSVMQCKGLQSILQEICRGLINLLFCALCTVSKLRCFASRHPLYFCFPQGLTLFCLLRFNAEVATMQGCL